MAAPAAPSFAAGPLAAYLTDPHTHIDLFGVPRGSCGCGRCGKYLKDTSDYVVNPAEQVRMPALAGGCPCCWRCHRYNTDDDSCIADGSACPRPLWLQTGRKHPHNDVTITHCSRCGCPAEAHEVLRHEQVCPPIFWLPRVTWWSWSQLCAWQLDGVRKSSRPVQQRCTCPLSLPVCCKAAPKP